VASPASHNKIRAQNRHSERNACFFHHIKKYNINQGAWQIHLQGAAEKAFRFDAKFPSGEGQRNVSEFVNINKLNR
jgi:hypothetical protein